MPLINGIPPERIKEIEAQAEVARTRAVTDLDQLGLPFDSSTDLRHVAGILTAGPVVAVANLSHNGERMAGLLLWNSCFPELRFEQYDPVGRQRFTIAHELGHFNLHPRPGTLEQACSMKSMEQEEVIYSGAISTVELEADAFAAAFLMPAGEFQDDIRRFGFCAAFLAARYGVSEAAVRRRMALLGAIDPSC